MYPQSVQQTSEISLNIFVSRKKCFVYNSRQAPLVPGEFWDSFTNHNTGNYLRHGIKLTANQRLSPTLRENQNAIKDGATEKSFFFWGKGAAAHKLVVSSKFVLHSVKNGAIRTIYRRSCENCIESSAGVLRLAWTPVNLLSLNSF